MESYTKTNFTIKKWAEEDRPREKLLLKGKQSLSDAELLAILIGSGTRGESAVDLSKRILAAVQNNLSELGKKTVSEMIQFNGIGQAKAITILAAMELGRRRQLTTISERPQIRSSKDAYNALAPLLMDLPHEEFWILLLNTANRVIGREKISAGGIRGTVADAKLIFKKAIEKNATGLILCHNHPSGALKPSAQDINLTKNIINAGKTLDIVIPDHLIIGGDGYFSFADKGIMTG